MDVMGRTWSSVNPSFDGNPSTISLAGSGMSLLMYQELVGGLEWLVIYIYHQLAVKGGLLMIND